jgi:hypothetical protein
MTGRALPFSDGVALAGVVSDSLNRRVLVFQKHRVDSSRTPA